MNLFEAISVRKSIRQFLSEPLSEQQLERLRSFFRDLTGLFPHIEVSMEILDTSKRSQRLLAWTGVKAPYYLAFYSEQMPRSTMNVGYLMEHVNLYLTTQGIGSCFIGSMKVHKDQLTLGNKQLVGIIACGRAKGSILRKEKEAKRLPLVKLCTKKEEPKAWMLNLLNAGRLAPSSMNVQPWRFVLQDNRIHIFSRKHSMDDPERYDELNFGILLANMMLAAEEYWYDVDLIRLENISQKNFPNSHYVLSAVMKEEKE